MAKATDPFISELWGALLAAKLPPGGHETGWADANTRIRNRFAKAVRQAMQSGAAFRAIPLDKVPVFATRGPERQVESKPARKKTQR